MSDTLKSKVEFKLSTKQSTLEEKQQAQQPVTPKQPSKIKQERHSKQSSLDSLVCEK